MRIIDFARELNALITELRNWRVLGQAVKRYCDEHPEAGAAIEQHKARVEAELANAEQAALSGAASSRVARAPRGARRRSRRP